MKVHSSKGKRNYIENKDTYHKYKIFMNYIWNLDLSWMQQRLFWVECNKGFLSILF